MWLFTKKNKYGTREKHCLSCGKHASGKPANNCKSIKHFNNYEKVKDYHRKFYFPNKKTELKLKVITYYSKETMKCIGWDQKGCPWNVNDMDVLTIDHINGGGNMHRASIKKIGWIFYDWLIKNNYPDGYQVLCMNCQFKKKIQKNEQHPKMIYLPKAEFPTAPKSVKVVI